MVKKGRPFEPGNQFGCGRPRGSRNKKSLAAQKLRLGFSTRVVVAGSQNVSPAFQKSGAGLRVQNLSNAPSKVTQKLFFKIVAGPAEAMWPVKPIFGVNWRDCQMDGFKLIALRRLACAMP
jgi:hypothetical protein